MPHSAYTHKSTCTKDNYSRFFSYKVINDPIYGGIGLSCLEIKLLDTRAMQRLRRIKQTGFLSFVFPGCEHSRFVHSLGVLYIMGEICDSLYIKQELSLEDICILRIAALLHDVGHFPFSHLTETVYSYINGKSGVEPSVGVKQRYKQSLISSVGNWHGKSKVHHERVGAEVIVKDPELSELLIENDYDPQMIGQIITGDIGSNVESYFELAYVYRQLMHSALDADRLDYLLRDSTQSGVVFGKIDLEYIIRSLKIVTLQNDLKTKVVAIDSKGQHAVEHFLMSRFFHYTQTISQKTAVAFEAVVKAMIVSMLDTSKDPEIIKYKSYESILGNIGKQDFYAFTDDFLWEKLAHFGEECKLADPDSIESKMWETISQRKKPRIIRFENDIIPKNGTKKEKENSSFLQLQKILESRQKEIAEKIQVDTEVFGYVHSSTAIDSLPSYFKMADMDVQDPVANELIVNTIKLINREKQISLLASDSTSLINKLLDYTADSLNIFILDPDSKLDIKSINKIIDEELSGSFCNYKLS